MNEFVHLNCHSNFSLLYGGSSIDELIERCSELGMDSLALTDRDGLYGAVQFYEKARAAGIKPIIGCDLTLAVGDLEASPPIPSPLGGEGQGEGDTHATHVSHVILLARDDGGYQNLCRAVTERRLSENPLSLE